MHAKRCPIDEVKAHAWFATQIKEEGWRLACKTNRSQQEREELLHIAHAACYHWEHSGDRVHLFRALLLISRAYSECGEGNLGLRYGREAKEVMEAHGDWTTPEDWAFLHLSLARSLACLKQCAEAHWHIQQAGEAAQNIENPEKQALFHQDLVSGDWQGICRPETRYAG